MDVSFVFQIVILIMSVVVHEVAHGYMAYSLGDPTAKYEGRLTLNPIKHLDPFGSVLVPTISYLAGGFIFGWAKPVPYNPYNLKPGRFSEALVAIAGPLSNIAIALVFSLFIRSGVGGEAFGVISALIVYINLLLAIFNLIPIPPLDGSKLLYAAFPEKTFAFREFFERFGMILIILLIFIIGDVIAPIVGGLFQIFTGLAL